MTTRDGRARYRAASRAKLGLATIVLVRLAPLAPQRAIIPIGGGLLAMAPAILALLVWGPHAFQDLWIMDDLSTTYGGISWRGVSILALAVAGAVVVVLSSLAKVGGTLSEGGRPATQTRVRVFCPSEATRDGDTTITGIARRASVEIAGPVSDDPCLVFGIRGDAGDAEVADADGGDFDVELPSGERVMISLEHALFLVDAHAPQPCEIDDIGGTLAELLENRGIPAERTAVLEELLLRDGDTVTVSGRVLGGTVTSLGYRGTSKARVLSGDEERPVIVRMSTSASIS